MHDHTAGAWEWSDITVPRVGWSILRHERSVEASYLVHVSDLVDMAEYYDGAVRHRGVALETSARIHLSWLVHLEAHAVAVTHIY